MVCRTCALFLLVKLFRLLHVQRVEREVLQRVPASLEAWMKWMKWMKSDMSLYDSPHALHLEDIIRSIVCSYYSSIGHIGSYWISSDQTTDFLSIDVPIIFESFIEILRSQKKKQRAALMISNAGNIRFGSRCSSWGNTSGFRASQGDENDPRW